MTTSSVLPAGTDEPAGELSDSALARSLGELTSEHADVNGVRLHYVTGGSGPAVVLMAGWPQTWWAFRHLLPRLAAGHRVIALDLRGMGGSDKPAGGYDKKTMAGDVVALLGHLGIERADLVGHDMGAMVSFSVAANHPEVLRKVVMLDVPHPEDSWYEFRMLPQPGQVFYPWWMALNSAPGIPEQLLAGNPRPVLDFVYDCLLVDKAAIGPRDRDVYARAYHSAEANRAGAAWYQAFPRDMADLRTYPPVATPILAIVGAGETGFMTGALDGKATDFRVAEIPDSGHYLAEERPEKVLALLADFLG